MNTWEQLEEKIYSYWDVFILKIPEIAISILIFAIFYAIAIFGARFIRRRFEKKTTDNITILFSIRFIKIVLLTVGFVLALHALGFEGMAGGLLAGAGVGAIIIGFAFKEIGENFLAGIILVFDRPFDIGDTVSINKNMGRIQELKFRTTHMKTFDGKDVYIPNSTVITEEVFNFTRDGFLRQDFVIGIDYDDDITEARQLIEETVSQHPEVLEDHKTQVLIDEFAASTVNLRVQFWHHTLDYKIVAAETKTQVMQAVKEKLLEAGFGLPANIQEIKMYQPDAIRVALEDLRNDNRSKS